MSTALTRPEKDVGLAYVLLAFSFFGVCGLHRLYMGRIVSGLIWLLTGGLCGLGTIVDLFLLPQMVEDTNQNKPVW